MAVIFQIKTKHRGSSHFDTYVGKNSKSVIKRMRGAIEDEIIDVKGRALLVSAKTQRERTLFLSAVFFQRVVNRTPLDEDYYMGFDKHGDPIIHHADNDRVRDSWYASYNNRKVTAKQLMEQGVTFTKFNDSNDIHKIYEVFRNAFVMTDKKILSIHIDNDHERFPMLEYGEYAHEGKSLHQGEKYYHGVKGGYSIQAPVGMLRVTQAEFQNMTITMSTRKLIKEYVERSQRTTKIPSEDKLKKLRRVIGDKTVFTNVEWEEVERIYGL